MIRKFRESDMEEVMDIWLSGNKDAHSFIPNGYWESQFKMVQEQLLQAEIYLYEAGGTILGFIGMQDDYVAGIFVKQGSRCAGIGRQLLDRAKETHSVLTLHVYQKNQRAVEFYKRAGFFVISEETDPASGEAGKTMQWYRKAKDKWMR